MNRRRLFPLLLALALLRPIPSPAADDPPQPNPRSKEWRQAYKAYLERPAPMQERIRHLDQALREEDSETQARLIKTMQRYTEWLEHLGPQDRSYVEQAIGTEDKIKRIRDVRERQWIATLPKADRDQIQQASPEERQKLIARLKQGSDWPGPAGRAGERPFPPVLAQPVVKRWQEEVQAKLSPVELKEIRDAQGTPGYILLLVRKSEEKKVPVPPVLQRLNVLRLPAVGEPKLQRFLIRELSESERKDFMARLNDSEQKDRARYELVELYWKRHPDELRRIREEDEKKRKGKAKG